MACGGVPEDGGGLAGELERDRALDGRRDAVAGLAASEELLRVFYRDFDGPAGGIALDDLGCRGRGIGGDEGEVAAGGGLVPHQHDGDGAGAEDGVPQAGDGRGLDRGLRVCANFVGD